MEITQELLHELFEYRDGELYWKVKPNRRIKIGDKAGSHNVSGYINVRVMGKYYRAHRLIYCMLHGYFPKYIDHINNNPSDNRIENLRECTQSENLYNKCIQSNNKSGHKGVSWDTKSKKWRVRVYVNCKSNHLGFFDDVELAALVAEEARNKYHGEFANHGNKNEVSTRHRDEQHS